MKNKNAPSLKSPEIIFLSFFGAGLLPKAPGTFGSLAALPFIYFLGQFEPHAIFIIPFIVIATLFSSYLVDIYQKKHELHDPGWIVIDEVLGMLTGWLFFTNGDLKNLLLLFIFFRIFDILKPWPISYFDKQDTGFSVIFDDIIAGLMTGLVILIFNNYI